MLISVVADASLGSLRPLRGEAIPVRGEIAIFGERDGHLRQTAEQRRARSPYLAACLVGRSESGSPAELLKAYLHPCAAAGHLMPVDSDCERHTLRLLRQLQPWLAQRQGIGLAIRKPVFDVAMGLGAAGPDSDDVDVCGPCIPDFLLDADRVPSGGASSVIVETMGYADAEYQERKQRIHALMSRSLAAPLIKHDFHLPAEQSQPERDRDFQLQCRWTITGKEHHRT